MALGTRRGKELQGAQSSVGLALILPFRGNIVFFFLLFFF